MGPTLVARPIPRQFRGTAVPDGGTRNPVVVRMCDRATLGDPRPVNRGLYALKPWYANRLAGVRRGLAPRGISPDTVTAARGGVGALAGAAPPRRLAAATLDGALGRETGSTSRWGAVVNELGDRAAELAALAGCFALARPELVLAGRFVARGPSSVGLA